MTGCEDLEVVKVGCEGAAVLGVESTVCGGAEVMIGVEGSMSGFLDPAGLTDFNCVLTWGRGEARTLTLPKEVTGRDGNTVTCLEEGTTDTCELGITATWEEGVTATWEEGKVAGEEEDELIEEGTTTAAEEGVRVTCVEEGITVTCDEDTLVVCEEDIAEDEVV